MRALVVSAGRDASGSCNNNDAAENIRPSAVFTFMVTSPGRIDFNASIWNAQPYRTRHPNAVTPMAVTWQYKHKFLNRRALGSDIEVGVLKPTKLKFQGMFAARSKGTLV